MNQPRFSFLCAAFFVISFFSASGSFAQTPPPTRTSEPSYNVVLQTVVASNTPTEKSAVSQSLASIVKTLKSDFPFSDYRLTSTSMQRVANSGNLEFKGIAYETNQDVNFPTFSEWSLKDLENLSDENGRELIQIQYFRFGQRIPLKSINGATQYESVGLTTKFSLPKNTPTVVGSVTTSNPDEMIFLILTVKPAEK